MADELPILAFPSQDAWEEWLGSHHGDAPGVWLKIAKKGAGIESVSHPEALEGALCFGWIDGQRRALDDRYFLQRFTPRGPRSRWSQINRESATRLMEAGRMRPARADGRWDAAYAPQRTATVPDDLRRALDANPPAAEAFETLDSQNRYAILYRVGDAKRPETRARRIAKFVAMLAEGDKPYP
jgi:uncharacterized protein YdeI (YjbR/CyaY-like superfamily)